MSAVYYDVCDRCGVKRDAASVAPNDPPMMHVRIQMFHEPPGSHVDAFDFCIRCTPVVLELLKQKVNP